MDTSGKIISRSGNDAVVNDDISHVTKYNALLLRLRNWLKSSTMVSRVSCQPDSRSGLGSVSSGPGPGSGSGLKLLDVQLQEHPTKSRKNVNLSIFRTDGAAEPQLRHIWSPEEVRSRTGSEEQKNMDPTEHVSFLSGSGSISEFWGKI